MTTSIRRSLYRGLYFCFAVGVSGHFEPFLPCPPERRDAGSRGGTRWRNASRPEAAKLIGIKTQTLAKWRWQGRGPPERVQASSTDVTYQLREVRGVHRPLCGRKESAARAGP